MSGVNMKVAEAKGHAAGKGHRLALLLGCGGVAPPNATEK